MAPGTAYLLALGITLAVEVPVYVGVAAWAGVGRRRALLAALGVNLLTHPLLYAGSQRVTTGWQFGVAEALVAAFEGVLLVWWWRVAPPRAWVWLVAVLANALSAAMGLAVFAVWAGGG